MTNSARKVAEQLALPIALFQSGEDLVTVSRFLGLGDLSPVVQDLYGTPQFLPAIPENEKFSKDTLNPFTGSVAAEVIQQYCSPKIWTFSSPAVQPKVVACQYGGECPVWFLSLTPQGVRSTSIQFTEQSFKIVLASGE